MKTLVLFCFILVISSCSEQSPEEIANQISKSDELTQIDTLCNDLPKPEDFVLAGKKIAGNTFTTSITYLYQSSASESEVGNFYSRLLRADGWEPQSLYSYTKGNMGISITTVSFPQAKYALYCAVVHK